MKTIIFVATIFIIIIALAYYSAWQSSKSEAKINQHIKNGDIDPKLLN